MASVTDWRRELDLSSWADFKSFIGDVLRDGLDGAGSGDLWYRGQGDSSWGLAAGLDRGLGAVDAPTRSALQDSMVDAFRDRSIRDPNLRNASDAELLAILQHHGSPTSLLDWSVSPYVAAFFAFSSVPQRLLGAGSDDADCSVFIIDSSRSVWRASRGVETVQTSLYNNERAWAQRGMFTLNRSLSPDLEDYLRNYYSPPNRSEPTLWKINISRREAAHGLRDLELMNITSETIYPGRDGEARYAWFKALGKHGLLN